MHEATKTRLAPWWVWLIITLVLIVLAIAVFNAIFPGGPNGSGVHR